MIELETLSEERGTELLDRLGARPDIDEPAREALEEGQIEYGIDENRVWTVVNVDGQYGVAKRVPEVDSYRERQGFGIALSSALGERHDGAGPIDLSTMKGQAALRMIEQAADTDNSVSKFMIKRFRRWLVEDMLSDLSGDDLQGAAEKVLDEAVAETIKNEVSDQRDANGKFRSQSELYLPTVRQNVAAEYEDEQDRVVGKFLEEALKQKTFGFGPDSNKIFTLLRDGDTVGVSKRITYKPEEDEFDLATGFVIALLDRYGYRTRNLTEETVNE